MADMGEIEADVVNSLQKAGLSELDWAAARLARQYAAILDGAFETDEEVSVFKDIGPKLNAVLNDLGCTPAGRRERARGGDTDAPAAPGSAVLGQLIRNARTRQRHA